MRGGGETRGNDERALSRRSRVAPESAPLCSPSLVDDGHLWLQHGPWPVVLHLLLCRCFLSPVHPHPNERTLTNIVHDGDGWQSTVLAARLDSIRRQTSPSPSALEQTSHARPRARANKPPPIHRARNTTPQRPNGDHDDETGGGEDGCIVWHW